MKMRTTDKLHCRMTQMILWDCRELNIPTPLVRSAEKHAASCAECAQSMGRLKDLGRTLQADFAFLPPSDRSGWEPIKQHLLSLQAAPTAERKFGVRGKGLKFAATMAGIATVAIWIGTQLPHPGNSARNSGNIVLDGSHHLSPSERDLDDRVAAYLSEQENKLDETGHLTPVRPIGRRLTHDSNRLVRHNSLEQSAPKNKNISAERPEQPGGQGLNSLVNYSVDGDRSREISKRPTHFVLERGVDSKNKIDTRNFVMGRISSDPQMANGGAMSARQEDKRVW